MLKSQKPSKEISVEDTYTACSIIEDFDGTNPSVQEQLSAWAYLIKTGKCWSLQGFYGRNAAHLIENKIISKEGKILKGKK